MARGRLDRAPAAVNARPAKLDRDLEPGDVIERITATGRVAACYTVVGYTSRGKVQLRRDSTGTTFTAWWRRWLPRRHRLAGDG